MGALRAFARNGYAGTTFDDIAAEVGVTQPRISQVFAGKLSAYLMAHDTAMETFTTELRASAPPTFRPATVHTVVEQLLTDSPQVPMIIVRSLIPVEHEPRLVRLAGDTLDQIIDVLRTDLHATDAQARATLANLLLTLVEAAVRR